MRRTGPAPAGRLLAGTAVLCLLFGSAVPGWAEVSGTVTGIRGSVTRKSPGSERSTPVRLHDVYAVGDVLETGNGSAVQLSLSDETFLNLAAGCAMRVNQYSYNRETMRRTARVRVIRGLARVVLFRPRSADSLFQIETEQANILPDMIADVLVEARPGETWIAVLGGSAAVKNASAYIIGEMRVGMNQSVVVRPRARPEPPGTLPQEERRTLLNRLKTP